MAATQQYTVTLILARELATNTATAMFIVDPSGTLVFYNEPAEKILGSRFAETGALGPDEWGTRWEPTDLNGSPLELDELPLIQTLRLHRPAHREIRIVGSDGARRDISVTSFPLFARADEFVGAIAVFWQDSGDASSG